MTEAEWLASDDPAAMLEALSTPGDPVTDLTERPLSDRKLRLFARACWGPKREWRVGDEGETPADGESLLGIDQIGSREAVALLRDIAGNPFRPVTLPRNPDCSACRGSGTFAVGNGEDAERMRCRCCPWLTPAVVSLAHAAYDHRDEQTGHLDPFRLALVADALEEAGCPLGDDPPKTLHKCPHCGSPGRYCSICYGTSKVLAACGTCLDKKRIWTGMDGMKWYPCGVCPKPTPHPILAHLRGPGPHVRGCHIIDLLTGRE